MPKVNSILEYLISQTKEENIVWKSVSEDTKNQISNIVGGEIVQAYETDSLKLRFSIFVCKKIKYDDVSMRDLTTSMVLFGIYGDDTWTIFDYDTYKEDGYDSMKTLGTVYRLHMIVSDYVRKNNMEKIIKFYMDEINTEGSK